jgi:hypothetical protein
MSDWNVDFDKLSKTKLENGTMVPTGSDSELIAEFTIEKVPNFDGTDFTEVPHLRLQAPGNTKTVYHQPVNFDSHPDRPSDPERFPREWAAFEAGQSGEVGTSIYEWEGATPADARRFDLNGIKTVQQLAYVSDANLQGLGMGALALRERARKFVSGDGTETQLRQEVSKLTDIVNSLLVKLAEKDEPKAEAEEEEEAEQAPKGRRRTAVSA